MKTTVYFTSNIFTDYLYKSFITPHLDYGNAVYDQPSNDASSNKLETVQYNATFSNYESNKRYISRKTISRIRIRISSIKRMDETRLLI